MGGQMNPEDVAYWYFRLNGCLTIQNFVIHPDWGSDQRTDVDIIAVRFPQREELLRNSMRDDGKLFPDRTRIRIIFAEVKTGLFGGACHGSEPRGSRFLAARGTLMVPAGLPAGTAGPIQAEKPTIVAAAVPI